MRRILFGRGNIPLGSYHILECKIVAFALPFSFISGFSLQQAIIANRHKDHLTNMQMLFNPLPAGSTDSYDAI